MLGIAVGIGDVGHHSGRSGYGKWGSEGWVAGVWGVALHTSHTGVGRRYWHGGHWGEWVPSDSKHCHGCRKKEGDARILH